MPNAEFLEEYPLYRKFNIKIPYNINEIPRINIKMYCERCKSNQTFSWDYENRGYGNNDSSGQVIMLRYKCAHCERNYRFFIIKIDKKHEYIFKVGQYPPWDIGISKDLKSFLGKGDKIYKNGKICESQGYGIGAFAYYRRVIEEVIIELLDSISKIVNEEDSEKFNLLLKDAKRSKNASKKIELVKDLLPNSLKLNGFNPLKTLYDTLSEGIHENSDDKCLEYSKLIRCCLEYLIYQVYLPNREKNLYTENIQKLISKRKKNKIKEKNS
ncbi:MAG: hypothetical protein ACFFDH_12145 [Promethearchaeota archaeon]